MEKEGTAAKMLDDTYLYVSFVCQDDYIWAEHEGVIVGVP